jgi:3-methyladenine DNA glycosylase AlkD
MGAKEILAELKSMGSPSVKKVLLNHGIREPFYGVKIGDMKKIVKRIKKDYQLALDLYDTGNYDAMYLAGLIADDARMTRKDLTKWASQAYCAPLAGATVSSVAAGSPHGYALALEWIESKKELVAAAGWMTLAALVSVKPDADLQPAKLKELLQRVEKTIHQAPDRVRYSMNSFVIATGSYVSGLTESAIAIGERTGPLTVDMGDTDCSVPFAPDYIRKVQQRGSIGKKRKSAKC